MKISVAADPDCLIVRYYVDTGNIYGPDETITGTVVWSVRLHSELLGIFPVIM